MEKRKPYRTLFYSTLLYTAWSAALVLPVGFITGSDWVDPGKLASHLSIHSGNAISVPSNQLFEVFSGQNAVLPSVLKSEDIGQYQAIFDAQKSADWKNADAHIRQLKNKLLVGHVLAERYLSGRYSASADELSRWLDAYDDHPQAADIYALALAKDPSLKHEVRAVRKQSSLNGYGDDNGLAVQADSNPYTPTWRSGLQAWKNGHKAEAAQLFATVAQHKDSMSPWMASAAAFWAYRSYAAIGREDEAQHYLTIAAQYPRSFYGILARKQMKQSLGLDENPVQLTESDVLEMIGDQTIRRVVGLAQAGFSERAEKELRARFPQADDDEKPRLLALAHELGLASVQISMAKQLGNDDRALDFARYPIPYWQPDGGFKIDPLLIYALVRQESGFRTSAANPSGAMGLMQLMPQTASLMQKQMDASKNLKLTLSNPNEPIANVTLGQNYVQHLLSNNLVDGNLVYLLAAYNAGPGRLQEWKASFGQNAADPLLFVENIPYAQTRHYVMQVLTNYWIYSELSGVSNNSVYALLHGKWPSYAGYQSPVADKSNGRVTQPGA